jgi:replication factor C small subunit
MAQYLWTEIYRPNTINEYVWYDENQREQVMKWVAEKQIPHLLFSGPAGTGKTSLAQMLVNELGMHQHDVMMINASRDRGIDIMRDKISPFAGTMPFGDTLYKIVILDEADAMTPAQQQSLKGILEEYAESCRFILTCNEPWKIHQPIHSRCERFHIVQPDLVQFTERVATILVTEGVEFDLDTIDTYVSASYPDMRKCLNSLQTNTIGKVLRAPSEKAGGDAEYKLKVVELMKQGRITEARKVITTQVRSQDIEDFFRWTYNNLDLWVKTEAGRDKAILAIRDGLVNHTMIADPEINLSATLAELAIIDE